jgi:hypothetical protein
MLLVFAPAVLVTVQFVMFATNKPPEYARFALILDVALLIGAFVLAASARRLWFRHAIVAALVVATAIHGSFYVLAFLRDCRPITSRLATAEDLKGRDTIRVAAEPAPYNMPPVDLFRTRLVLNPWPPDVMVIPSAAPISWADVRFAVSSP